MKPKTNRSLGAAALLLAAPLAAQEPSRTRFTERAADTVLLENAEDQTHLVILNAYAPARVSSGSRYQVNTGVGNRGPAAAINLVLRVELPAGTTALSIIPRSTLSWNCLAREGVASCSTSRFSSQDGEAFFAIDVAVGLFPRGGVLTARVSVTSDTPESHPDDGNRTVVSRIERVYAVTSSSDAGAGSLRNTLEEANRDCDRDGVPCRIAFRIPPPVPETGWFTIELRSPLPAIEVTDLVLDGEAQTALTEDTNPKGPEVFLDGRFLKEGNGLEVRSRGDFAVSNLVISGFPENGILFDETGDRSRFLSAYLVANNYIGTDPTGRVAIPNGLRGIATFVGGYAFNPFPWAQGPIANLTVRSNLISGNGRSGIFVHSGYYTFIERNRIGVKAESDEPLPNGASGIYFGIGAGLGCVDHNVIAYNDHFGIALEKRVSNVWIAQNSIKGNKLFGLDIGLDLATPGGTDNVIGRPVLVSARFDGATGQTTILGRLPTIPQYYPIDMVDIYSNTSLEAKGEGETWLGLAEKTSPDAFRFVFPGDLRGKAVTATATRTSYQGFLLAGEDATSELPLCQSQGYLRQTSEFSDPIEVTR